MILARALLAARETRDDGTLLDIVADVDRQFDNPAAGLRGDRCLIDRLHDAIEGSLARHLRQLHGDYLEARAGARGCLHGRAFTARAGDERGRKCDDPEAREQRRSA